VWNLFSLGAQSLLVDDEGIVRLIFITVSGVTEGSELPLTCRPLTVVNINISTVKIYKKKNQNLLNND
jgi:hypothetical protein